MKNLDFRKTVMWHTMIALLLAVTVTSCTDDDNEEVPDNVESAEPDNPTNEDDGFIEIFPDWTTSTGVFCYKGTGLNELYIDHVKYNITTGMAAITGTDNGITDEPNIYSRVKYKGIEYSITAIGGFEECKIKRLNIPTGIETIENKAFYGCNDLTTVSMPSSLKRVEEWAFSYCSKLTSLEFPESVESIEGHAMCGCCNLEHIKLPESLTCITTGMLSGCSGLRNIKIPKSVISIC